MADTEHGHGEHDPNAAPMHHEIDERFSGLQVGAAIVLAIGALGLGIVAGLLFANT